MSWLKEVIGTEKAIIAMCHLAPLPGDPLYNAEQGMEYAIERARADLRALQNGGVDAVMFSNEYSLPYLTDVKTETVAAMARIVGELMSEIRVPFGVNVLWDAWKSLDLAAATGAKFIREIFSGVYASDFGLWNTNCGETVRHQHAIGAQNVKLLFNIVPEASAYLAARTPAEIARSTVFNCHPDALCVSGQIAGAATDTSTLAEVKKAVPEMVILANTGCRKETIGEQLSVADGAVVATTFKYNGVFENMVDEKRVSEFMDVVRSVRE